MDKYTIRFLALASLTISLHLVCHATVAQCRIMSDVDIEKISLPHGLCVHVNLSRCSTRGYCNCCLVDSLCYPTMDGCERECKESSSSEDMLRPMTPPYLLAP
ncbi:hypothetical protein VPH35_011938 [Triticum aestivum]